MKTFVSLIMVLSTFVNTSNCYDSIPAKVIEKNDYIIALDSGNETWALNNSNELNIGDNIIIVFNTFGDNNKYNDEVVTIYKEIKHSN